MAKASETRKVKIYEGLLFLQVEAYSIRQTPTPENRKVSVGATAKGS